MLPIISNSFPSTTAATDTNKSIDEFADMLIERCTWFQDLSDMTFSHVQEIGTMLDQAQLLISAIVYFPSTYPATYECNEDYEDLNIKVKQSKEVIDNVYHSTMQLKDHEISIKSVVSH